MQTIIMCSEFKSISELKNLIAANCKIEKVYPQVFASDVEINIVTVIVICPGGITHTIRAYREEANALREFIRTDVDS
jgi:hypothetical protein